MELDSVVDRANSSLSIIEISLTTDEILKVLHIQDQLRNIGARQRRIDRAYCSHANIEST